MFVQKNIANYSLKNLVNKHLIDFVAIGKKNNQLPLLLMLKFCMIQDFMIKPSKYLIALLVLLMMINLHLVLIGEN